MNLNHLISQCLHLRYLLLGLLTLSHYYGLIDFRFSSALLFICRIRCLIDFCFLSFGRFVYRFASSFLTTVGCTLLIASTPFVFVVSTPLLFVAWSIAFLFAFIDFRFSSCFSSSVAFGVWSISAF